MCLYKMFVFYALKQFASSTLKNATSNYNYPERILIMFLIFQFGLPYIAHIPLTNIIFRSMYLLQNTYYELVRLKKWVSLQLLSWKLYMICNILFVHILITFTFILSMLFYQWWYLTFSLLLVIRITLLSWFCSFLLAHQIHI